MSGHCAGPGRKAGLGEATPLTDPVLRGPAEKKSQDWGACSQWELAEMQSHTHTLSIDLYFHRDWLKSQHLQIFLDKRVMNLFSHK